jgi:nitroimidazol reductase NimA-like FMN-containing flavoprotein (pyridoxamine 5'-phosphate oxidase superfamily)
MKREPERDGAVPDVAARVRRLFASQRLGVLSTQRDGGPYASLVAFAGTKDLAKLYFATSRSTRKYANLSSESRVALLVDDRRNELADFHRAEAVTVLGRVRELKGALREEGLKTYLDRHPHLEDFARSPSCALLEIAVERCILVVNFQRVSELDMRG